jgi:uracil-DNA glycosylase
MNKFDPGPSKKVADLLSAFPDHSPFKDFFWYDWGPVFYRGRMDGSAKILCIASDPGPTERIAGRTLVGNAGQRVQGFLNKAGITHSYVCLNGFIYALFPGKLGDGLKIINDPAILKWRNNVFKMVTSSKLKAIVAFGEVAHRAIAGWDNIPNGVVVYNTYHPSYRGPEKNLLDDWNKVITAIRSTVKKDRDGRTDIPLYGDTFTEDDYSPVPKFDLPFGLPSFVGDDSWARKSVPSFNNSVRRPDPDDRHTLTWKAPDSSKI